MDSKLDKQCITEMAHTMGWKQLTEYMEAEAQRIRERLTTADPEDSLKIVEYQVVIKTYRNLMQLVNSNTLKS
jgi:hypothetical protein